MAIWDDVITDQDRLVYEASGYGEGRIGPKNIQFLINQVDMV